MKSINHIYLFLLLSLTAFSAFADSQPTVKQERNYIVEGNSLYRQERYAEAEAMYKKALTVSPASEVAQFNLAAALLRQSGSTDQNNGKSPMQDAIKLLTELEKSATSRSIAEKAAYDLGNVAFNSNNYGEAIEHYKNALRKNPDNDKARQNLRLAQKKQQEQQQNQQNQDKNKEQNQDQNQDKQQQDKQQRQQQYQNKEQEKNQNQDQNKDNSENKDKEKQKQQQQPQGSISDDNANKILKAMENEEAATRKKVEARKKKADNARRRQVTRPW